MERKKVLLKFYSELNLGDDLFLKIILERYPNVDFYLLSDERYKVAFKVKNDIKNLIVFKSSKQNNLYYKAKRYIIRTFFKEKAKKMYEESILETNLEYFEKCDVFVSIGGSIFMEKPKGFFDQDKLYYRLIGRYFDNKSVFFLGCNFGPYKSQNYIDYYTDIFKNATDVCFREVYSKDLFCSLNNVRVSADIVFGLKGNINKKIIEDSIGFSVITARGFLEDREYILKYVDVIKELVKKGKKVYLFSFCDKEGDADIIKYILEYFRSEESVFGVFYDGDINKFLELYSSIELMFCSRFHSMILSMLFGQKIHPIIYSKKMVHVLEDISYSGSYTFLKNFLNLDSNLASLFVEDSYNIDDFIIDSERQFIELDKVII